MSPYPPQTITYRVACQAGDREGANKVRRAVFIQEQGVPEELEMDAIDNVAIHLVAVCEPLVIGTARLFMERGDLVELHETQGAPGDEWHVGRVAVLPDWRGRGVGAGLMALAEQTAREQGAGAVVLNAQVSVLPFYERLGYMAEGEVFKDAGIPHRTMRRHL